MNIKTFMLYSVATIFCAAAMFAMTLIASADNDDYFVAENGDDINDCMDQNEPCKTLTYAFSRADDLNDREPNMFIDEGTIYDHVTLNASNFDNVTITGAGAHLTTISGATTEPPFNGPVFTLHEGRKLSLDVTMEGMTIRDGTRGQRIEGEGPYCGGGIYKIGGYLSMNHMNITENEADVMGGGICHRRSSTS